MAETAQYFSTKYTVVMNGVKYIPAVCYKLDETIAPTIAKLVEAGEAKTYAEKVRFVNGAPLPAKKPEVVRSVVTQSEVGQSGVGIADVLAAVRKNKKSGQKDFE